MHSIYLLTFLTDLGLFVEKKDPSQLSCVINKVLHIQYIPDIFHFSC